MSGDNEGAKTSEYQSKYAPDTVYQPNVNTDDSDEVAAQSTYQGVYGTTGHVASDGGTQPDSNQPPVAYPTLKMAYGMAPRLETLTPPVNSQDSGSSSAPDLNHAIFINLAALLTTERSFLAVLKTLVDEYENTLVPEVKAAMASTTLFGQNVTAPNPNSGSTNPGVDGSGADPKPMTILGPFDQEGADMAKSINVGMAKLLQQTGDVIELFGQFTACINQAGQLYATADSHSAFPPYEEMIGPVGGQAVHSEGMNGRPTVRKISGTSGQN